MIVTWFVAVFCYLCLATATMIVASRIEFASSASAAFCQGVLFPFTWVIVLVILLMRDVIFPVCDVLERPFVRLFKWSRNECAECNEPNGRHLSWCKNQVHDSENE